MRRRNENQPWLIVGLESNLQKFDQYKVKWKQMELGTEHARL